MSKLEMIVKQRRLDVAEAKTRVAAEALRARVAAAAPPNDFAAVLSKSGPMALLAEMKRASPSKGDIAPHTDAVGPFAAPDDGWDKPLAQWRQELGIGHPANPFAYGLDQ